MEKKLMGVFAPVTTPFDDKGEVAYDKLRENMAFYAKSKLKGYLALGSNGENKSLTNSEKEKVLETIIKNKGAGQVVMAGCIFESTKETIEFAKIAQGLGADFITLLPPSYFKKEMTDPVLLRYFTDVADSLNTPCLVYNAPQFCGGTTLSVSLVKELAKHPNIVGLKDSSTGNIESFLFAVRDVFNVMPGSANFFVNGLIMGAPGGVISLANVFPDITCRLYELTVSKQYEEAFKLNERVIQLNKTVSGTGGVAAVKYAMDLAGLYGGNPRLPLLPLADEIKKKIQDYLKKENLI
ncbi:MAG TPA: dihydrodipicolinate synthase family protein [Bacteroidales bacterium]|nr:dihydrodipicolinate synthase family protein [Bacteroidales bacterium]HRR92519.1 dihydrodipicolinate synthase family protein [Bacteroidales bacterium]HRT88480.1 dihydrodipicolinate synthase family protein [Bacteroidales bacterium]